MLFGVCFVIILLGGVDCQCVCEVFGRFDGYIYIYENGTFRTDETQKDRIPADGITGNL